MIGRKQLITSVLDELNIAAAKTKIELHPSFKIELENYARHNIVKSLPEDDLRIVLKGIGQAAIQNATGSKILGGNSIRTIIVHLCDDPFSDCSLAAARVLEATDRQKALNTIHQKIAKLYKTRGSR